MRMQWDESKQKLVPGGVTRTGYDDLPLPGGRKVQALGNGELANALIDAKVPGVSHTQPRRQNLEAYKVHLDAIGKRAADAAVQAWLRG